MSVVMCWHCEKNPASCIGRYDCMTTLEAACDECCGHGCEDGRCYPLDSDEGRAALAAARKETP